VLAFRATTPTKNGSRETRVGLVLRLTGIGNLPQLINVVSGQMSIVGLCLSEIANDVLREENIFPIARSHIRPGMISLAQVNGFCKNAYSAEERQQRFRHDLYYIQNWSLLLDMKIVFMRLFSKMTYRGLRGSISES
jgi:lipopolysaccharide/colanic/teichoic acid biosynthesis glycosyltransferase